MSRLRGCLTRQPEITVRGRASHFENSLASHAISSSKWSQCVVPRLGSWQAGKWRAASLRSATICAARASKASCARHSSVRASAAAASLAASASVRAVDAGCYPSRLLLVPRSHIRGKAQSLSIPLSSGAMRHSHGEKCCLFCAGLCMDSSTKQVSSNLVLHDVRVAQYLLIEHNSLLFSPGSSGPIRQGLQA